MSKEKENETETTERVVTQSVTWRMPKWVAEAHAGDWSEFRDVLNQWAANPEQLDIEQPEETTSVCLRVPVDTLAELEKEAKRLSKLSKRKWTSGKVARVIYESQYQPAD